jgi:hypothetical protein
MMPRVYPLVLVVRPSRRRDLVRRDATLVIDGAPRSGNTFAVTAFQYANGPGVAVAGHLHSPAQLARAARFGIPALVLLRNPTDAAVSWAIREPGRGLAGALRDWIRYYQAVWPFREHFVLAEFDEVISDFGSVTLRLNERFGTRFVPYSHSPEADQACFTAIDDRNRQRWGMLRATHVPRPTPERDERAQVLRHQLDAPQLRALMAEANSMRKTLVVFDDTRGA